MGGARVLCDSARGLLLNASDIMYSIAFYVLFPFYMLGAFFALRIYL